MIQELRADQFLKVKHLFEGPRQYIPALAVIEGNFPGRVFVDSPQLPTAAMVWAISRWAYIEGDPRSTGFIKRLGDFIRETVIPASLEIKMNWFELYAPNDPEWTDRLDDCLAALNAGRHLESVYVWDAPRYLRFRSGYNVPEGLITELEEVPILPYSARGVSFVSRSLAARTAPGFRLSIGDRVVAQCRSNGFVSGYAFMIDVDTYDKADRGRGYATAAGVALLDYCIEKNLVPVWETTEDNAPSRRLADRLGFVEDSVYPVYAIEFQG